MLKSLLTRSVHNNQLKLGVRFRGLGPKHKVKVLGCVRDRCLLNYAAREC